MSVALPFIVVIWRPLFWLNGLTRTDPVTFILGINTAVNSTVTHLAKILILWKNQLCDDLFYNLIGLESTFKLWSTNQLTWVCLCIITTLNLLQLHWGSLDALTLFVGWLDRYQCCTVICMLLCLVSDIAIFVLKRDVKLQLTNYK